MKKFLLISCFLFYVKFSYGQSVNIITEIDTCTPVFKEVYDFQIGDIFQYVQESATSSGGIVPTTRITSKYTITGKTISADTFIYSISGLRKTDYWCDGNPVPDPICDPTSSSDLFNDTLVFVDSVNHFLNQCKNEFIADFMPIEYNWITEEGFNKFYTYVQLNSENDNPTKSVGGSNNIFYYNEEDSLIAITQFNYEEIYGKNLGKIRKDFWYFELNETEYLQGYIKDGDTTGTITPDIDLMVTDVGVDSWNIFNLFPNPSDGFIFFNMNEVLISDIKTEVYNLGGQCLLVRKLTENYIDLTALSKGMYYLKMYVNDNILTKKVLIK